ncbi:MAG: hypothetical protein INH41_04105 [Myxococcaceae bacterium]|jgi:hypothetical protein|nr:hypothetical protein [Myxococcaceae bacterium]MCA3011565.1 hypothetical protein [Myxococcaceae bacterium]
MSDADAPAPPVPTFEPHDKVCGNCKLWRVHSIDASRGWVGECRVQPQRALFPPSAPICNVFAPRGEAVQRAHDAQGPQRPRALKSIAPLVRTAAGATRPTAVGPTLVHRIDPSSEVDFEGDTMTRQELMELFLEASGLAEVPLAQKWEGGTVKLVPANPELQAKDLPIDALFHKVVMVRDRLRVLEQKLNAHPKLTDAEKVEMQQYVTRCYGSLTTFNVLFREKSDQFVGQKGDE